MGRRRAGVEHQKVEVPVACVQCLERRPAPVAIARITLEQFHPAALFRDRLLELRGGAVPMPRGGVDSTPGKGEGRCDVGAEPPATTNDERDLAVESSSGRGQSSDQLIETGDRRAEGHVASERGGCDGRTRRRRDLQFRLEQPKLRIASACAGAVPQESFGCTGSVELDAHPGEERSQARKLHSGDVAAEREHPGLHR